MSKGNLVGAFSAPRVVDFFSLKEEIQVLGELLEEYTGSVTAYSRNSPLPEFVVAVTRPIGENHFSVKERALRILETRRYDQSSIVQIVDSFGSINKDNRRSVEAIDGCKRTPAGILRSLLEAATEYLNSDEIAKLQPVLERYGLMWHDEPDAAPNLSSPV